MTYERLITAVDEVAPQLSDIAYKLLWRLIALAIHRGTPQVEASIRRLATNLALSKEGVARATRELAQYITVTARDGEGTTFSLPAEWFPPQRTLFSEDRLGGDFHNRPISQDASVLFARTPVSHLPGHQRPISQDTRPICQDTSVPFTRTPVPFARTDRPICQDTSSLDNSIYTRARVDRIDRSVVPGDLEAFIDRALSTEEIQPPQQEAAEILSEEIQRYRLDFGPPDDAGAPPDRIIVARMLAIAPIEQLCEILRTLRSEGVACGRKNMWFFVTLMQRIHRVPSHLTMQRYDKLKAKEKPSYDLNPSLFQDELVNETMSRIRKIS